MAKSHASKALLARLTSLPTNLDAIEALLDENRFSSSEISRAAFDFASFCDDEAAEFVFAHPKLFLHGESKRIPRSVSASMPAVFALLLGHGLDPNFVCSDCSLMELVAYNPCGYAAADTLLLLLGHGGDPFLAADGETLFEHLDSDVIFGAIEQEQRAIYDAWVHAWFVLLAFCEAKQDLLTVFPRRSANNDVPFSLRELKDHRRFTFALTRVPGRGEPWSLSIIDKRTHEEVARL